MKTSRHKKLPEIISHRRTPELSIYSDLQFERPIKKRALLIIVLLIIVFALGLSNAFIIMNYETNIFDPNRFVEVTDITVSGKVIDKNTGENLEGALIVVKGTNHSVKTDMNGWFTLESLETGKQVIQATKSDYKSMTKEVFISSDSIQIIDFELVKGEGAIIEELKNIESKEEEPENNGRNAGIFGISACFAIFAIGCIFYRKFYWLAVISIVISLLSVGFFVGIITGTSALILLFSITFEV